MKFWSVYIGKFFYKDRFQSSIAVGENVAIIRWFATSCETSAVFLVKNMIYQHRQARALYEGREHQSISRSSIGSSEGARCHSRNPFYCYSFIQLKVTVAERNTLHLRCTNPLIITWILLSFFLSSFCKNTLSDSGWWLGQLGVSYIYVCLLIRFNWVRVKFKQRTVKNKY